MNQARAEEHPTTATQRLMELEQMRMEWERTFEENIELKKEVARLKDERDRHKRRWELESQTNIELLEEVERLKVELRDRWQDIERTAVEGLKAHQVATALQQKLESVIAPLRGHSQDYLGFNASNDVLKAVDAIWAILDAEVVDEIRGDSEFMDGCRRGAADVEAGKITPWADIKPACTCGASLANKLHMAACPVVAEKSLEDRIRAVLKERCDYHIPHCLDKAVAGIMVEVEGSRS